MKRAGTAAPTRAAGISRAGLVLGLCLGTIACGSGEASVALVFPNTTSMEAIRRLQVQVFPPSTGGTASSDRDCRDFDDLAREGKEPLGTPTRGDFPCPEGPDGCPAGWYEGLELQKIESGRQIVYVLAYATTDKDATPVLDGCTDRFDGTGGGDESQEVPIELKLVIPESARLVKTAGDRQVGRAGELAAVPLEVKVEADSPTGNGGTYVIPGVPVRFTAETAGYEVLDGDRPDRVDTYTGADGRARAGVRLPDTALSGRVLARAAAIADRVSDARAEAAFSLSVTEPAQFGASQVLQPGAGARPISLALGNIDAGTEPDLVVLSCRGTAEGCTPGIAAQAPFGRSELTVVQNVGGAATLVPVTGELGVLPAAVAVADVEADPGLDEIVVVNSRRADCQDRVCPATGLCDCYGAPPGSSCPCEGSEVRIFAEGGGQVALRARRTMTASNAIGAQAYKSSDTEPYLGLAIASQGRSRNNRPCSTASPCLPHDPMLSSLCATEPESCGCPPGESCEPCPGCNPNDPGICVARDKIVDLLERDRRDDRVFNRAGCQSLALSCDINQPESSSCECFDAEINGNRCTERDACNCKVPERIHIGSANAAGLPFGVAAGALDSERDWDLVSPSIGGLELIENLTGGDTFEWRFSPIINVPIHAAVIAHIDTEAERDLGAAPSGDVVWHSRERCSQGSNFNERCPLWREAEADEEPKGCLGVYFTNGADSLFGIAPPSSGGCRRHLLDEAPDGLCVGRFNPDDFRDVAVTSRGSNDVLIYAGDGRGGLLDPPDRIPLPGGGVGGPMVCGDIDGDGRDDVIVADAESGAIYVLGTRP